MQHITPLTEGNYFHLYNRGINGENLFKQQENYYHFLKKYEQYCSQIFETYAYALLRNYFHLVVYVKENVLIPTKKEDGFIQLNGSKQLSHLFNSYAQAINRCFGRTGSLFERPFERELIHNDKYLMNAIAYCHFNAQKHEFVNDFKDWEFSSYHDIIRNNNGIVESKKVLELFGGLDSFNQIHDGLILKEIDKSFLE